MSTVSALALLMGMMGVLLSGHSLILPAGHWVVLPMRSLLIVVFALLTGLCLMTTSDFDGADTGLLRRSRIAHFYLALLCGGGFFAFSEGLLVSNGWPMAYVALYSTLYVLVIFSARYLGMGKAWVLPLAFYLFVVIAGSKDNSDVMAWWSPMNNSWGSALGWTLLATALGSIFIHSDSAQKK